MSRVITFSRFFPKYHSRAGKPTFFVEAFYNSLAAEGKFISYAMGVNIDDIARWSKKHTIRKGDRWKAGDKFSPRVWSDVPYNSKQIILCDDVEIKQVWSLEVKDDAYFYLNDVRIGLNQINIIAENDGLTREMFLDWFKHPLPFKGQIICWTSDVQY